jgi:hypothetical protein
MSRHNVIRHNVTKSDEAKSAMKLTLILDAAPVGVRASLVEEWDEIAGGAKMEPRVRQFDSEEQALAWGRLLAHQRGLKQLFLTDNRKSPADDPGLTHQSPGQ